jgi:hypothetical protein
MTYTRTLLLMLAVCLMAVLSPAQQKNKIEGVWQALSLKTDGKDAIMPGNQVMQVKYITAQHWAFVAQDKAKQSSLLAKKMQGTGVEAYDAFGAGAGTYKLTGNAYSETVQYFTDPSYIGLTIDFTVRVEGDRLYQSGKFPMFEGGKKVKDVQLEEVYKRIE